MPLATPLLALVLSAGCGGKKAAVDPGPACPEVVDHMLVVMKQGLTGHDSVQLGNRDQMIAQCESRKMSAEERTCLRGAKALHDLANCRKPAPGAGSPSTPTPLPTTPAPAPIPAPPAGSGT